MSHIHPLDKDKVDKIFNESITASAHHGQHLIEHRLVTPQGEVKVVEERWKITHNDKGDPLSAIGICQDITERKKAEEERNTLQRTLENSLNEIYVFDDETFKFSYVNKGALYNLGYSKNEIEALTPLDLKPEFTEASFKNLVSSLTNNEKREIIFFTSHKRKNGTLYPVEVHLQLVSVGTKKKFVAIILDITERKKVEEEIKFKANLLNTIEQAAIATNLNGIVNYWNNAAENIYGWSQQEAIGKNIINLTTPEPSKEQAMQIMQLLKKGKTWSGNFKVRKKDGTEFIALVSNSPVYDEHNILSGIIGVSTDVSQKIKNEELLELYTQQLESSNERFEKVTEATDDAIWDWDMVNQTYYRSKSFERFFGKGASGLFTDSELWSRNNYHPDDQARVKNEFYETVANPLATRWESEFRLINDFGELFYVIDRAIILRNNDGKAIRTVGAMTDISEQKQMSVQLNELNLSLKQYTFELERSNEELEQFAFIASHDLQEPLRMVTSFMDQLKRKYGGLLDEKGLQYIYFAADGAKRMKQIILDLLQYSRASKQTEGKEAIDMNELIVEFKQLRRKVISEKKASIYASQLPILHTYKAAITQIIHCLLDNAIKYTAEGTSPIIQIATVEHEKEWEFSIQDNGIGVEPQFYNKIFVIFQRLHNRDEYAGTGIGLSIAKRHVEFLGGRIWLQSAPKAGTIFYFTIPKVE